MLRTARIILDKIGEFTDSHAYIFITGFIALVFHCLALDLAGILTFAVAICLSLLFVKNYKAYLTPFANIIFIVSTQNSPAYGDGKGNGPSDMPCGANYYMRRDVLYPLIIAVAVIAFCFIVRVIKDRENLKSGRSYITFAVASAAMLLAGAGSAFYFESVKANALLVICLFGLYVAFTATLNNSDGLLFDYISTLLAELALLIAIEVFEVYYLNLIADGSFGEGWKNKIITGWGVSNVSGELIAMFLPFAYMKAERGKHVVFYELSALISSLAIVFTLSRTGILVGGIVAIIFAIKTIINRREDKRRLVVTFIAFMSVLLGVFIALLAFTDFTELFDYFGRAFNSGNIGSGRFRIWGYMWDCFLSRPVLGVGNAQRFFAVGDNHGGFVYSGYAHNLFFDALGGGGIIGVAALIFFVIRIAKIYTAESDGRFFLNAFFIASLAAAMFDITYALCYCLWFFALVTAVAEKLTKGSV